MKKYHQLPTLGKSWCPSKVPGHWGHWHFSGSLGHWDFEKVLVARQSPRPMRPLTFLRVTGSLGHRESPGGPARSRPLRPLGHWAIGKVRVARQVPGHWGHWHFSGSPGLWAFGKVPVAWQSPRLLRPLTFLRVTGSMGLQECPGGPTSPGPLRPLTFLRVTGSLGLWESPCGPAKSRATEATDISQGHQVTGPSGKSWWPSKVPGYWGHWHFSGSQGHWAFGNVLAKSWATEATNISQVTDVLFLWKVLNGNFYFEL